jgi:hypothetical protein
MWQEIVGAFKKLILLDERTEKNTQEVEKLRHELNHLVRVVERLADRFDHEMQRLREHEEHERKNLRLWLENEMLRREKNAPPTSSRRKPKQLKPADKSKDTK